jgi:endonuclease/exonuclease/phosphatase (EEP) superfamily protein YafD
MACYKGRMRRRRRLVQVLRIVVTTVVVLVGLATLIGLLDRFSWVFEIADIFRVQYIALLVVAALAALAMRQLPLAIAAVVLAVVNAAVVGIPFTASEAASSQGARGSLRVVMANVEVGNSNYASVESLVARTKPEVFGVVELTPAMAEHLGRALPGYAERVLEPRPDAYGIGVFSRLPLLSSRIVRLPAGGAPSVVVRIRVSGQPVAVVFAHVRTLFAGSIHVRQLRALADATPTFGERVAILGDFNTPPWSGPLRQFAADAHLRGLYGLDVWRAYSWPSWSRLLRLPLDNCFVSRGVGVKDHHRGPGVGSDHFPLVVDLGVTDDP